MRCVFLALNVVLIGDWINCAKFGDIYTRNVTGKVFSETSPDITESIERRGGWGLLCANECSLFLAKVRAESKLKRYSSVESPFD